MGMLQINGRGNVSARKASASKMQKDFNKMLLTISEEEVEWEDENGNKVLVTNMEMLARVFWRKAINGNDDILKEMGKRLWVADMSEEKEEEGEIVQTVDKDELKQMWNELDEWEEDTHLPVLIERPLLEASVNEEKYLEAMIDKKT